MVARQLLVACCLSRCGALKPRTHPSMYASTRGLAGPPSAARRSAAAPAPLAPPRRFKKSVRFGKAVGLINRIDTARLPRVLTRVLQKLPHKVRGSPRAEPHASARAAQTRRAPLQPARPQTETTFSEAEATQLCELFELSEDQLTLLLSGSSYIFEEGAYATTPPAKLAAELVEAGVEHEQAEVFAAVWRDGAEEYIQQCKVNSVLAPQQLTAVDWQLAVDTADSSGARAQRGHALLELRLANAAPTVRRRRKPRRRSRPDARLPTRVLGRPGEGVRTACTCGWARRS